MPPPAIDNAFATIKARYLLAILLLSFVYPFILISFHYPQWTEKNANPVAESIAFFAVYSTIIGLCFFVLWQKNLLKTFSFGARSNQKGTIIYLSLAILMIATAVSAIFVLYLPLSYIWPEFVKYWLLDQPPLLIWRTDTNALVANIFTIITIVFLGPVVEEVFFRGFLLNRWHKKYGLKAGIVVSSLLFGILHADLLGAFLFGIILSLIYLQTKSLFGPIIIHVANNGIVVAIEIALNLIYGPDQKYSINQFQAEWYYGIIATVIMVPWLIWLWKH